MYLESRKIYRLHSQDVNIKHTRYDFWVIDAGGTKDLLQTYKDWGNIDNL